MAIATRFTSAILLPFVVACGSARTTSPPQAQATIPFEAVNNLVLLPVRVNGSEPAFFILDTGASASVINTALAGKLGLKLEAGQDVSTSGGTIDGSVAKDVSMSLPQVALGRLSPLAIPLAGVEAGLGRAVGGILGSEIFDRFVVEIDYAARNIRLFEPGTYRYLGLAEPLAITFEDHTPFVHALVAPAGAPAIESRLLIDSGAGGALTLNSAFVNNHRLVETVRQVIPITSGAILAGKARAYVGRLGELRVGAVRLAQPVANLSRDTEGDEASTTNDGFIGGEVLRRFTLITDYVHARIIMEPTDRVPEAFEFDMSGLSLAAEGPTLDVTRVRLVIAGSPAAGAGVAVGDVLVALDGVPVSSLGLDRIRRMFRMEGQEYQLSLRRGETSSSVRIKTRRLV